MGCLSSRSLTKQRAVEQSTLALAHQQEALAESEALNRASMLEHLNNVLREYPQSARAQARFAGVLLENFENMQRASDNAMPINQIREAALAGGFRSADQLRDWMQHAFGQQSQLLYQAYYHARRALELCPLQGEAYLCLAELSFLEGPSANTYQAYEQQGLQVCPCNCELLFAFGKNRFIAGDEGEAVRLWQKAFLGAGNHRDHIIRLSGTWMTAPTFLETYKPEWDSLNTVWHLYRESGEENRAALLSYATHQAEEATPAMPPHTAGGVWLSLAKMQNELVGPELALKSLQQAYLLVPDRFAVRYELGKCLLALEQYAPAEAHLRWCNHQIPGNAAIRRDLQLAIRGTMQQLARSTRTSLH